MRVTDLTHWLTLAYPLFMAFSFAWYKYKTSTRTSASEDVYVRGEWRIGPKKPAQISDPADGKWAEQDRLKVEVSKLLGPSIWTKPINGFYHYQGKWQVIPAEDEFGILEVRRYKGLFWITYSFVVSNVSQSDWTHYGPFWSRKKAERVLLQILRARETKRLKQTDQHRRLQAVTRSSCRTPT